MCGIFGIHFKNISLNRKDLKKNIEILTKLSRKRGQDTFGLSISHNNNEKIFKVNCDPLESIKRKDYLKYLDSIFFFGRSFEAIFCNRTN